MYRLGINYSSTLGLSPEENFSLFKNLGFDAVFTGCDDDLKKTERYANAAAKSGLFFESLHAPFDGINHIWEKNEAGDLMQARICSCIERCAKYDIPIAVVHLSSGDKAPHICDTGKARFDEIVECAVKNGVTVAFENQRKLANLAFAIELYDNIENVGFCWDVGHEHCFADGREYMPFFGKKLVYTHIHDNFCEHGEDLHMIPFDGKIDFERAAEHIRNSAFSGTLTLEIFAKSPMYDNMTAQDFYKNAYSSIEKFRKMCMNTEV